jgi:hypothetical protein
MKLADLSPNWCVDADIVIGGVNQHFEGRTGMGMTFACPHCAALNPGVVERGGPVQFLGVWFANPADGKPPTDGATHLWERSGDSFETLTLSPSVDASESGHWHGFIRNGEIV